jgi:hypothetical protein
MSTPSAPPPPGPPELPGPPAPPPGRVSSSRLVWLVALAMVVVVAGAVVTVVWLTRDDGQTAASVPTTVVMGSSSTEPTSTTTSPAPPSSTAAPAATSTSSFSPVTTSTSTTTTLPPGACTGPGAGPIPDDVIVVAEVMGDFNGSGVRDDRFVLLTGSSGGTRPRIELSYGYSVSQPTFTPRAWAGDARAVNLGGPADLAVVQIVFDLGRGAYLWVFQDCELRLVMEQDTHVMGFALVDGPGEKRGLTCQENGISLTEATSEDGITWLATSRTLIWDPATASLHEPPWLGPGPGPITPLRLMTSPENDAEIRSYAAFDC